MRRLLLIILALIGVLVLIGVRLSRMAVPVEPEDPHRVTIDIPQGYKFGGGNFGRQLDISPDGKKIVFVGRPSSGDRRLYLQTIGETTPNEIPGTALANDPTFAPDGRHIVFHAEGNLKKVALDGTGASMIAKTGTTRGVTWLDGETLILSNLQGPLLRVPVSQGEPAPLTESMGPHLPHLSPSILPGGKAVLFTYASGPLVNARIGLLDIETGKERELLDDNGYAAQYVSTGHIVFARGFERQLMAVRFNLDKLEIVGSPAAVLDVPVSGQGSGGSTNYGISTTGTLVYTPRHEGSIDDLLAEIGNVSLIQIHVQSNWFDEVRRRLP